jgi:hypothetical protein
MNRIAGFFLLAVVVVGVLLFGQAPAKAAPIGYEAVKCHSAALSGDTALIAATSGKRIVVKALVIRSSGAGVLVLKDGSGGSTIANLYLAADTNYVIGPKVLGEEGIRTSSGVGLYAAMSTNTITTTMRIIYE